MPQILTATGNLANPTSFPDPPFFPMTTAPLPSRPFPHRRAALGVLALAIALFAQSACQTNSRPGGPGTAYEPIPGNQGGDYPDPNAAATQPRPTLASFPVGGQDTFAPSRAVPGVTARAAIVIHANTGRVLYEKNADTRLPIASTQKLLLGLMVAEAGDLNKRITVQKSDTWAEPTIMGIKTGETYRKADLLKAVLVRSSNDIARCLARDHSGSDAAFAAAMDRRARSLGMNNSHFTNSNGLPSPPGQFSTARDLSILATHCMRNAFIRDAVSTKAMTFTHADGRTVPVRNTNKVLTTFPYCTGMKTGYTNAAGRCLVSSASYRGKNVIVVILGSQTPNVWNESQALLQWGLGM